MSCTNCKKDNLYPSNILALEERKGILEEIMYFLFCKDCGNVMMKTTNNQIVGTDHIKDSEVIKLAYRKIFKSSRYNGPMPVSYGYTKDGERKSINELEPHMPKEKSKFQASGDPRLLQASEEPSLSQDLEEPINLFSKAKRFVKKLFRGLKKGA